MPEISRFFGIVISMNYDDHNPPHFHVRYGEASVTIEIAGIGRMAGRLPQRAMGMVVEWARQHQRELFANWELAKVGEPLKRIPPLE